MELPDLISDNCSTISPSFAAGERAIVESKSLQPEEWLVGQGLLPLDERSNDFEGDSHEPSCYKGGHRCSRNEHEHHVLEGVTQAPEVEETTAQDARDVSLDANAKGCTEVNGKFTCAGHIHHPPTLETDIEARDITTKETHDGVLAARTCSRINGKVKCLTDHAHGPKRSLIGEVLVTRECKKVNGKFECRTGAPRHGRKPPTVDNVLEARDVPMVHSETLESRECKKVNGKLKCASIHGGDSATFVHSLDAREMIAVEARTQICKTVNGKVQCHAEGPGSFEALVDREVELDNHCPIVNGVPQCETWRKGHPKKVEIRSPEEVAERKNGEKPRGE